jgi:hypothetical protein
VRCQYLISNDSSFAARYFTDFSKITLAFTRQVLYLRESSHVPTTDLCSSRLSPLRQQPASVTDSPERQQYNWSRMIAAQVVAMA